VNSWLVPGTTNVAPFSDVAKLTMHLWQFERAVRTLRHGKDALEAVRSPQWGWMGRLLNLSIEEPSFDDIYTQYLRRPNVG